MTTGGASYGAGQLLGDLVLAAEQPLGEGRVFVLGDTRPLHNEMLATSYPFVGRLLAYLAGGASSPQAIWRQFFTLAALGAMLGLLAVRPAAWQLMLTPAVMAVSLTCCAAVDGWSGRVLPDGRPAESEGAAGAARNAGRNNVAYIDASHLESYGGDSGDLTIPHGIAGLVRVLMRQGYLPLLASDLSPERLARCGLLISIAPAREFSRAERAAIQQFVHAGGTFACLAGAEDVRASKRLLADFHFKVPPSPVPPDESAHEPEPLRNFQQLFDDSAGKQYVEFYAGWPVEGAAAGFEKWVVWSDGKNERTVVARRAEGAGAIVVIADTHFADNENLETIRRTLPDNIRFWRWLLGNAMPGQKMPGQNISEQKMSGASSGGGMSAGDSDEDEEDSTDE